MFNNKKLKSDIEFLQVRVDGLQQWLYKMSYDLDLLANAMGVEFRSIDAKRKLVKKSKKK